jgi:transketolase
MRRKFASDLYELMKKDKNIVLITADLGYIMFDRIKKELSKQFFNVGVAEQAAMDISIGMAMSGKIPVVYSITPFLIFRTMESIRNYIDHEKVPVIMVGSGRGEDYVTEGFSHNASDDVILKSFENIVFLSPENDFDLKKIVYMGKPVYLNLKR